MRLRQIDIITADSVSDIGMHLHPFLCRLADVVRLLPVGDLEPDDDNPFAEPSRSSDIIIILIAADDRAEQKDVLEAYALTAKLEASLLILVIRYDADTATASIPFSSIEPTLQRQDESFPTRDVTANIMRLLEKITGLTSDHPPQQSGDGLGSDNEIGAIPRNPYSRPMSKQDRLNRLRRPRVSLDDGDALADPFSLPSGPRPSLFPKDGDFELF